jgi:hypothetical protein
MPSKLLLKAQQLRAEAERVRLNAEHFAGQEIRLQLLDIAAQYDRLAESLDLHAESRLLHSS